MARRRIARRAIDPRVLCLEALDDRRLLTAGPSLLADMGSAISSSPAGMTTLGDVVLFSANGPESGRELWKTDGTEAGTALLKDINPQGSSNPGTPIKIGNAVYFTADDGVHGREIWKSDGTEAGTTLLKDIQPGSESSYISSWVSTNSTLYFVLRNSTGDPQLWKSDGTEAGTTLVTSILPGVIRILPIGLTGFGGAVYFFNYQSDTGYELWRSDGTAQGTVLVKDINPGPDSATYMPVVFTQDGELYFSANDGAHGDELWKSDGTTGGTVLVKDVAAGPASSQPSNFASCNGQLYFRANDGTSGEELWRSGGTAETTEIFADLNPGAGSSSPSVLATLSDRLVFTGNDGAGNGVIWSTDGVSGTVPIKIGPDDSYPSALGAAGGILYFMYGNFTHVELWKTDGAAAGTELLKAFDPGILTFRYPKSADLNDRLIFAPTEFYVDNELWKSDGTAAGTTLVKDIRPELGRSYPQGFTNVNGTMFFFANDNTQTGAFNIGGGSSLPGPPLPEFRGLFKSDGTAAGTTLVTQVAPRLDSEEYPGSIANVNGTFYFNNYVRGSGTELWASDGTEAGTRMIKWLDADLGPLAHFLTALGGYTYFVLGADGTGGLWRTDGTSEGTTQVSDFAVNGLLAVNGSLFMLARDPTGHYGLWTTDGSPEGTVLLNEQAGDWLSDVDNTLYFSASDAQHGTELWKSDGSPDGTALVKDILPGSDSSSPSRVIALDGKAYFTANDGSHGVELWRSDGTADGTELVTDLVPAGGVQRIGNPMPVGHVLYFTIDDPADGFQLWKTDGSPGEAAPVATIPHGTIDPRISEFAHVQDRLFFRVFVKLEYQHLSELWQTDGTPAGTSFVGELVHWLSGPLLAATDDRLFYAGESAETGDDPWIYELGSEVVGRGLFYNYSTYDGNNTAINAADDLAIAPDKTAYLPGSGPANFTNVSSYSRGINGIVIDLRGGHGPISADDFLFTVGNDNGPDGWAAAPAPSALTVRAGAGLHGADRVEITWTNGAIKNTWLRVQMLANEDTNLEADDVFFWGSKIGDTGGDIAASDFLTSATDAAKVLSNLSPSTGLGSIFDFNRDGLITAIDKTIAVSSIGALVRIDIPDGGPVATALNAGVATGELRNAIASALADYRSPATSAIGAAPTEAGLRHREESPRATKITARASRRTESDDPAADTIELDTDLSELDEDLLETIALVQLAI